MNKICPFRFLPAPHLATALAITGTPPQRLKKAVRNLLDATTWNAIVRLKFLLNSFICALKETRVLERLWINELMPMGRISEFSVGIFIIMRKFPIGAFKHCNNSFKFDNWLQQEIRSNFMNLDGSYVCHCQCTARCEPAVCRRWTVGRKEGRREGGGMIERPSVRGDRHSRCCTCRSFRWCRNLGWQS